MREDIAEVYERLADKCGDLLVQYTTSEKWFRYQGQIQGDMTAPFEKYTFMDIIGDFDHKVDIESFDSGGNSVKAQTIMNIVQQALDPNMMEVGAELKKDYRMVEMVKKAAKFSGVDLDEFKKPKEEQAQENDPYQENRAALGYTDEVGNVFEPVLLSDPLPGEEWHLQVHIPVAMATKNEEIARHVLKHKAIMANTPQGVQQAQMQAQQQPQGMTQPKPLPIMPNSPKGQPVPAQVPPGVQQQMNPMVR